VAATILSYQTELGGWPKNIDTTKPGAKPEKERPTFDNNATMNEMRSWRGSMSRPMMHPMPMPSTVGSIIFLKPQYPTGGWPPVVSAG